MATKHGQHSASFVAIGLGALALGLGAYFLLKPKAALASGSGSGAPDLLKAAHAASATAAPAGMMNVFGGVWNGSKWTQGPSLLATEDATTPQQTIQTEMQAALATMTQGGADLKTVIPAGSIYYEWGVSHKDEVVGASKWDPRSP